MKTKVIKFVLSAFALLLAVSFAFAIEEKTCVRTAYYDHPFFGAQEIIMTCDCQSFGIFSCTYMGFQLYAEANLITPLKKF